MWIAPVVSVNVPSFTAIRLGTPMIDDAICNALRDEVEKAKHRHQRATEEFRKIMDRPREMRGGTGGLPVSESLQDAAREESRALQEHAQSLMRLNEYLLTGKIPPHLKMPAAQETASGEPKVRKADSA